MTINITTTSEQDAVIQYQTDLFNANMRALQPDFVDLTAIQFIKQRMANIFSQWKMEYLNDKMKVIQAAYLSADDTKRAAIDAAAQ